MRWRALCPRPSPGAGRRRVRRIPLRPSPRACRAPRCLRARVDAAVLRAGAIRPRAGDLGAQPRASHALDRRAMYRPRARERAPRRRRSSPCHLRVPSHRAARARRSAASGRPQRAAASTSSRTAQFDKPMSARTRDTLLRGRERLVVAAKEGAQPRGRPLACGHPPAVAARDASRESSPRPTARRRPRAPWSAASAIRAVGERSVTIASITVSSSDKRASATARSPANRSRPTRMATAIGKRREYAGVAHHLNLGGR